MAARSTLGRAGLRRAEEGDLALLAHLLVETFAFMVDELSYRLNRVPDRLYPRRHERMRAYRLQTSGVNTWPQLFSRTTMTSS